VSPPPPPPQPAATAEASHAIAALRSIRFPLAFDKGGIVSADAR
jgi:hypothetical protein